MNGTVPDNFSVRGRRKAPAYTWFDRKFFNTLPLDDDQQQPKGLECFRPWALSIREANQDDSSPTKRVKMCTRESNLGGRK
mmetsp:Transcript_11292/g.23115  ORF Transcript_11292/g.23115 Transcript_11292/m.23115 type:complete len:81 (+) Transcript_11292:103-345(+)